MDDRQRQEYSNRRSNVISTMAENSIALVKAAPRKVRNGDVHYHFRQDSYFYYLTGISEPDAVLALIATANKHTSILFIAERDPEKERWEGSSIGPEEAMIYNGIDLAYPLAQLSQKLPELLAGKQSLYTALGADTAFDQQVKSALAQVRTKARHGVVCPSTLHTIEDLIGPLRLQKTAWELEQMRKAAAITVDAHRRGMQECAPGLLEYQLAAIISHEFYWHGSSEPAYSTIVGGGANACILHYTNNNCHLIDGELVLVDAGAEWQNYAADVTRTYPVNGCFTEPQRVLYELVLRAQLAGIAQVIPGNTWHEVQQAMAEIITEGLLSLGIINGNADKLLANQAYKKYYLHGAGHWLGLDVHDVGPYREGEQRVKFKPDMVLTVEPGIYLGADCAEVPAPMRAIGIRIEDDILVTANGPEVLTAGVPKEVAAIESLMAESYVRA